MALSGEMTRDFIPYGFCRERESPHAKLDAGDYAGEEARTRLIILGEEICRSCPQFEYCRDQQDEIASALWERGLGSVLIGGTFHEVASDEVSPVAAERYALRFDYREVSDDPETKLFQLRQAVRAGSIPLGGHDSQPLQIASWWLKEEVETRNPDLQAKLETSLHADTVHLATKIISRTLLNQRLFGITDDRARARKADQIIDQELYKQDGPIGFLYLADLCHIKQLFDMLEGQRTQGTTSQRQEARLPNLAIRHSPDFIADIFSANIGRHGGLSGKDIGNIVISGDDNLQAAIDRAMALEIQKRTDHPRPVSAIRSTKIGISELGFEERDQRRQTLNELRTRYPFLESAINTIIKKPDPVEYARSLIRSVDAVQQDPRVQELDVQSEDILHFMKGQSRAVLGRLQRFVEVRRVLTTMYAENEEYDPDTVRTLSLAAANVARPQTYYSNLLRLETDDDNDGSLTIRTLHAYARMPAPVTYAAAKSRELARNTFTRSTAGANRWLRNHIKLATVERIAALYGYGEITDVTDQLVKTIHARYARGAYTDPQASQPSEHRALAQAICDPEGGYMTFTEEIWRLPLAERLCLVHTSKLDLLFYGQQIDPVTLEVALNTRNLDAYTKNTIKEHITDIRRQRLGGFGPEGLTSLGRHYADIAGMQALQIYTPQDTESLTLPYDTGAPTRVIDTVVAELIAYGTLDLDRAEAVIEPTALTWLANSVRHLYAPVRQARAFNNVIQLVQEGILLIEPDANDSEYRVRFADAVFTGLPAKQAVSSLDLQFLSHYFEIDRFTHNTDLAAMLQERVQTSDNAEVALSSEGQRVYELILRAIEGQRAQNELIIAASSRAEEAQPIDQSPGMSDHPEQTAMYTRRSSLRYRRRKPVG